jgi:GcrA cell cycle regulator
MFVIVPTWTTERLELLKTHFDAGLSCREIAAQIGVSRNAVIGKLSRLGLTRGESHAEPRPKKPRGAQSSPRLEYQMLRKVYEDGEPVPAAAVVSEHSCSLLELSKQRCRWPTARPAEDFCFCGNTPPEVALLCRPHLPAYAPVHASALPG